MHVGPLLCEQVEVKFYKALRGRNKAISMIYDDHDDSYGLLPKYLHMLKQFNPGTVTHYRTGTDQRFEYACVAWGPCINAFMFNLRQVIVVQGTHLKGKCTGILFVAVTKDCNEQVLSLAIGVGPIENNDSWMWFMRKLRVVYPPRGDLVIVSYQHLSIRYVVEEVYPEAAHCLCTVHLQKKLTSYGRSTMRLFRKAATAYTKSEFRRAMVVMQRLSPEAYNRVMEVGPERWALSHCKFRCYTFLSSNCAEYFNGRLLWARRLPICSILDCTYNHGELVQPKAFED